jgi:hypothetical protein
VRHRRIRRGWVEGSKRRHVEVRRRRSREDAIAGANYLTACSLGLPKYPRHLSSSYSSHLPPQSLNAAPPPRHQHNRSIRLTSKSQSSPRATSPNNAQASTTARPASPKPPGGPATVMRRKAAADRAEKTANQRPSSTRAAGAGGSSSTMLSKSYPGHEDGRWEE